MSSAPPLLVLDTGSPVVSLALGRPGELIGMATVELRQSSERLLSSLDKLLKEVGWPLSDLGGVLTLRGPGSFTGLRIGLATTLGLHQALDLPATGLDTLSTLAAAADVPEGHQVTALVDAMRGQWMAQTFNLTSAGPEPLNAAQLVSVPEIAAQIPRNGEGSLISFSIKRLEGVGIDASRLLQAPPLASVVIERVLTYRSDVVWDPARLIQPIYFRPPATTAPKPPKTALQPRSPGRPINS